MWLVTAYVPLMMLLHPISVSGDLSCFKRDPSPCMVGKKHSDWRGLLGSTKLCARSSNKECTAVDAYNGTRSKSTKGRICEKWNKVIGPLIKDNFTDTHNFCRNPRGRKYPYCYTKHRQGVYQMVRCFEKCDINYYEECGYAARNQNTVIPVPDLYNCTYMLGTGYLGNVLSNISGNPEDCCQKCRIARYCVGYTWLKGTCKLFKSIDNIVNVEEAISGESCKDAKVQDFQRQNLIDKSGDCTYLPGIEIEDSTGDNIFGTPSTISVGSCCHTCIQSSSCLGYTWTNGMCHLKSSLKKYKRTTTNVYISGEVCVKGAGPTNSIVNEEGDLPDKYLVIALVVVPIFVLVVVFAFLYHRMKKKQTASKSVTGQMVAPFSLGSSSNTQTEDKPMTGVSIGRLSHDDDVSFTDGSQFRCEGEKAIQSSSTGALSPDPEFESQYLVQEITQDDPNREMMSIVKERELYGVEEGLELEPSKSSSGSSGSHR